MKKFLSLALALIMTLSLVTISAGATEYKDFTDKGEIQYEEAVAVLNRLGIITGYSEGDFRPEGELTRGAAAKIIVSLLIGPEAAEALPTTNSPYPDVPAGNVFAGYISFCKTEKIINGYNDGTFRPSGTLTGFAFAKMLLSALGYDGNIEGFTGSGWTVRVSALGSKANLFNRLDFKGGETVNRETACLLALNTLKATMVQYTGGMNITTSDGSTMVVNPTREYVTSNQDYAAHIDNRKVSDKGNSNSESHYTVEFGEEHFKDLRMDRERDNDDQFGRPSNEWSYKKVTIGTYPIEADFTYTTQVIHCVESTTAASKTRALGLSGYEVVGPKETTRDKQTQVWLNGAPVAGGISDVSEIADYTDNGTLVEVYVSDEDADFITDVVVVKTQLMEVKRVGSDYVSLDLYDDGSDSEGKPVFGYNSVPIDKKVNDVEVDDDCYNQLKEMKAGDIVAVVPVAPDHNDENTYDVAKVYAPETATGNLSRVETYGKIGEQNAIGVTVGGTAYKIALWNKDLKDINGEVVNLTKKDVTVYLDEYGNALLAKDVGGTKDWMVIKNYRQGLVNGVIVTYVNGWDIDGNEVTLNIGGGSVADAAKENYKPGDLVRYESDSSSNTAEWALSMTNEKGVFKVAKLRDDDTTKYTISASNTTIKLDNFDNTANLTANKDLATIDNGIKFIYVSVDKDGEVDGIEFVNGVKSADNDEIIGKDSSARGVKNAQACVSLKDGKVTGDSAVKAVVIKRESTDASVSNLLYISKYLGSATRHDGGTGNNNNIVYSYEVVMMGPGGKLVDDDLTIYSYKNLAIGQFARYTKATAPEGMDGVNNDNFYDLRGYGVYSGSSHAYDTFGRSAAVVKSTVIESLKANKYLLKLADYDETTVTRSFTGDNLPKIAKEWSVDNNLDLGDIKAENLVNARGVAWVDLRDVKNKIDDIDSLKDYVNGNPDKGIEKTPIRVTMLFNDNPDSDDFRRVYLIIIHGPTSYTPSEPDHEGNVSITLPAGTAAADVYSGTVDLDKTYKPGDSFTVVLKPGYKFGPISGATLGVDGTTFTVTDATVSITIVKNGDAAGNITVKMDAKQGSVIVGDVESLKTEADVSFSLTAPEWAALAGDKVAVSDATDLNYTISVNGTAIKRGTITISGAFTAKNGTLEKDAPLTLHIGSGTDTATDVYLGNEVTDFTKDTVEIEITSVTWAAAKVDYKLGNKVIGTGSLTTANTGATIPFNFSDKYTGSFTYTVTGAAKKTGDGTETLAYTTSGVNSTTTWYANGGEKVVVTITGLTDNPASKRVLTVADAATKGDVTKSGGVGVAKLLPTGTTVEGSPNVTVQVTAKADGAPVTAAVGKLEVERTAKRLTFGITTTGATLGTDVTAYNVNIVVKDAGGNKLYNETETFNAAGNKEIPAYVDMTSVDSDLTLEVTATPVIANKISDGSVNPATGEISIKFKAPVVADEVTAAKFSAVNASILNVTPVLENSTTRAAGEYAIGALVALTNISKTASALSIEVSGNITCKDGSTLDKGTALIANLSSGNLTGDTSTGAPVTPDAPGGETTPGTPAKIEIAVAISGGTATWAANDTITIAVAAKGEIAAMTIVLTATDANTWTVTSGAPSGYTGAFDGSKLTLTASAVGVKGQQTSDFGAVTVTLSNAADSSSALSATGTLTFTDGTDATGA